MNGRSFLSVLVFSSFLLSASGQQPSPQPQPSPPPAQKSTSRDEDQDVVRITTNLVQVDAVVMKDGKQVTDLKPEDFEILEDGRPQPITSFSYISNLLSREPKPESEASKDKNAPPVIPAAAHPNEVRRTVAFLVDDLGMSFESMAQTRRQLRKYIDEQLQPNDLVAIVRTGGEVGSLQQFTADKRLLRSAIEHLRWNHCSRTGPYVFTPVGSGASMPTCADAGGPSVSLRAFRFVLQGMRYLPGRKAVLILSDSLPIQSQEPGTLGTERGETGKDSASGDPPNFDTTISYEVMLRKVAEVAIRSSVVIYAVDTRGLQYTGITAADNLSAAGAGSRGATQSLAIMSNRSRQLWEGREGSDLIARQTGGFLIRNSNDFGIQRVMDDQRGYYLIGYRPSDQTFNRRFHHIKVRVKGSGLTVRTREGFYGVTEGEARSPELTLGDQKKKALISPFGANEITVNLTTVFANDAAVGDLLRSFLHIDPNGLTFVDQADGSHTAAFELSSIVFGDNGKVLSWKDQSGSLRLRGPSYDRALREGVSYSFDTPVKQFGALQFRVAVRDTASSRIGSAGQVVEVPNLRRDQVALSGIVVRAEAAVPSGESAKLEIAGNPALRRFQQGSTLVYAYVIYKALVDTATHLPQLSTQTRIFRDGKSIFTGNAAPLDVRNQTDFERVVATSRLLLGPELPPGDYVLQVIVTDQLGKEKQRVATQWIDFEVIK